MKQGNYGPRAELNDVSFITEHFCPGKVHLVRDLGGTYNLNLLLQTEQGRYVLRIHRPWVTQTRLLQLHQLKHLLASADFPVPLPLRTSKGQTILHYADRLVEMEPFIVHDGKADTWERNAIAFSLLGRLHAFLATEAMHIHLIDPVVSNYGTPKTLLTWTRQATEESTQAMQTFHLQEQRQAHFLYTEAIQLLLSLQERWNKIKDHLPKQLTHGDFGGGNLLFQHERPVALLDFDFFRIRERVFEIAYTLYWWLWQQGQLADTNAWRRAKDLLISYNQATPNPLTAEEIQALPLEMASVPLYWIAETHFLQNPVQEVLKHTGKIADARGLLEHSEQLADLLI